METPHGVKTTVSLARTARSQDGAAQRAEGGKGEGFQSGTRTSRERGGWTRGAGEKKASPGWMRLAAAEERPTVHDIEPRGQPACTHAVHAAPTAARALYSAGCW